MSAQKGLLILFGGSVLAASFTRKKLDPLFDQAGSEHKVSPQVLKAIAWRESRLGDAFLRFKEGDPRRQGVIPEPNGTVSYGIMQVNSVNLLSVGESPNSILIPERNIRAGAKILADMKSRFPNMLDSISAYNAGRPLRRADGTYINGGYVAEVFLFSVLFSLTRPLNFLQV